MAQKLIPNLAFTVRRREAELIAPSKQTPRECKLLSDIDDQHGIRFHLPFILFYPNRSRNNRDPVKVIREALAEALVFYYPFAGRLRELAGGKLMVECTGEGILFIEADADVRMEQFRRPEIFPPFPCFEELIYNVPASDAIVNSPLLLIQVTRLLCGGFILGFRVNHCISDSSGMLQFMTAVGEIAHGARVPSVQPLWQRELLSARVPPRVTCTHVEFDQVPPTKHSHDASSSQSDVDYRSFLFGPTELSVLRKLVPEHLSKSSRFDILTACLWRCRTIALQVNPDDEVRIIFIVDVRRLKDLSIPRGYYGNALVLPAAVSTAGELTKNSIEYALKLVIKAKSNVTSEYVRSTTDLIVSRGRPHFTIPGSWMVSDTTRIGFKDVDLGWGKAEYGGLGTGRLGTIPGLINPYVGFKNNKGENIYVVSVCLPRAAMERFVKVLGNMLHDNKHQYINSTSTSSQIISML